MNANICKCLKDAIFKTVDLSMLKRVYLWPGGTGDQFSISQRNFLDGGKPQKNFIQLKSGAGTPEMNEKGEGLLSDIGLI
jgi:hypothetical protein